MPDDNDIVFTAYQLDIGRIIAWLAEKLFGIDYVEVGYGLATAWYWFSIVSFAFSVLLLIGIIYAVIRAGQLSAIQQAELAEAERAWRHAQGTLGSNSKWAEIETHATSGNPGDWRLAIIEADIMLDALLTEEGYPGGSVGEKLKSARPESFASLQDAWDAHKIRNDIAHRGSDFVLTQRSVTEAIAKYRRVFEEFGAV